MRRPRFTARQLFLLVALCALAVGFVSAAWRARRVSEVSHVEFSPDDKLLFVAYNSGWVQLWDVSQPRPRLIGQTQLGIESAWPAVCFVDARKIVYAIVSDRYQEDSSRLKLWDLDTGQHSDFAEVPGWSSNDHGFFAEAGTLVVSPDRGSPVVEVIDVHQPANANRVNVPASRLLALSPDGKLLTTGRNGIELVDLTSRKVTLIDKDGRDMATFGDNGETLLLRAVVRRTKPPIEDECFVRAYDTSSGALLWELSPGPFSSGRPGRIGLNRLRLSADGKRVSVVKWYEVTIYDVSTKQPVAHVEREFHERGPWWTRWFLPEYHDPPWQNHPLAGGVHRHGPWPSDALSHDGKMYAKVCNHKKLTLSQIEAQASVTVGTCTSRWFEALLFACGFVAWGACWGTLTRRERRRLDASQARTSIAVVESSPDTQTPTSSDTSSTTEVPRAIKLAWGLMILSGAYLIVRTMGIVFQFPAVWPFGIPFLVVGLYSVTRGVSRDRRRLNWGVVLQMLCFVSCDPLVGLSAVVLLVLVNIHRVKRYLPLAWSI